MFQKLNTAIHQFSKRQMTWFRKMERAGFVIHWLDLAWSEEEKMYYIQQGKITKTPDIQPIKSIG
jgi:tRNA dimethylallyltransferase